MQAIFTHISPASAQLLQDWLKIPTKEVQRISLPQSAELMVDEGVFFFIPEPLIFEQNYYYVTDLWQKYFAYHQPTVKVVGVGYDVVDDNNYLDLFNLPEERDVFLNKVMNAEKNIIFRKGKGESIQYRTKKFFEGHGDQSVTDELDKVLRILQMAQDEMSIHKEPFSLIQDELFLPNALPAKWDLVKKRWSFYHSFFKCTPFYTEMEDLWQLLQKISPFFDGNCTEESLFWDLDCVRLLKKLKKGLSSIEKIYVG